MNITIYDGSGLPRGCDTEGCRNKATSAWSSTIIAGGASGTQHYACDQHNPIANMAMALPLNFHSQPLCHACGQPVNVGSLIASTAPAFTGI